SKAKHCKPLQNATKHLFIVDLCLSEHTLIAIQLNSIPFEILPSTVNAADNKQRDKNMSAIKINIDPESNTISIWNNGKGIPVVEHKDEKMYVPALIFGHLLTSSNYDDDEKKVTGGRNGYGAKLCNIFSTKFTVETACKEYRHSFKQTWQNNMSKTSEPKLKFFDGDDFTCVTFQPDLSNAIQLKAHLPMLLYCSFNENQCH
uniref:Histidine kinase/HSP90-like ATPase domain-containing protein n=1 Tax=Hippocampus comes TaxID=109280 RepID=A0A3Q2YG68_HIPCM